MRNAKGRSYVVFANSDSNSKGVAILTAAELNITAISTHIDPENFFIFIHTQYMGQDLLLGAIYGPNSMSRDFYRRISHILSQYRNCKVIIGGDWNTLWDNAPLDSNIDVYKMAALPNLKNSELLRNIASDFNLTDPFRVIHPYLNSYTYSPFGRTHKNRSRLDFFVISNSLLPSLLDCSNSHMPTTNLFDHKAVSLFLGPVEAKNKNLQKVSKLRNTGLSDPILLHKVSIAAYKSHLYSLDTVYMCEILGSTSTLKNNMLHSIKLIESLLDDYIVLRTIECERGGSNLLSMQISEKNSEILLSFDELLCLSRLGSLPKNCEPSRFFEVISEQTRVHGIKAQKILSHLNGINKKRLILQIETLGQDFAANGDLIIETERLLGRLVDTELRDKLEDYKVYEILHAECSSPHFLDICKKTVQTDNISDICDENGNKIMS